MFHNTPQVAGQQQVPVQQYQQPQYAQPVQQPMQQQFQQQPMVAQQQFVAQGPQEMQQQQFQQAPFVQPMAPAQQSLMQQPAAAAPTVQASNDAHAQTKAYLDAAGVSHSQVEQELKATGTLSAATKQALVASHGESTTNLLVNSINTSFQSAKATADTLVTERHNYVAEAFKGVTEQSGDKTFNELVGWWQETDPATGQTRLDANTKRELNKMLAAGGMQANMALDHLINGFRAGGMQQEQAAPIVGNNNSGLGGDSAFLDATAYANQYHDIMNKEGPNSPKLRALDAQRSRSMARQPR